MVSPPNRRHLKCLYQLIPNNFLIVICTLPLVATILLRAARHGLDEILACLHALRPVHPFLAAFISTAATIHYLVHRPRAVYLVDYACFQPNVNCRMPMATFIEHMRLTPSVDNNRSHFMARVIERSGLGNETNLPHALQYIPPRCGLSEARAESELVVFSAIDDLLAKTCIKPNAIDILIVNCSLFNPTPSFVDMIINRYKLRSDIRSVNLSGMGCSAGLISVGLARNLLQLAPWGAQALVVSTEILSHTLYEGRKRAMQLPFALFRMGGAAVLLSTSKAKARFRLKHILRTFAGTQDNAYGCVIQEEDEEGNLGVNLSKDLITVAGDTLKASITAIGPLVLPTSEKLLLFLSLVARKVLNERIKLYVPNFCKAFEHFCIHAGGPAVIDAVQHSLSLSDEHAEPSRMTLHRFGNTSSSSLWYELAYIDAKGRMQRGDRVWMIGFGSGYKCNTAVWECIQPPYNSDGPWAECIHRYPMEATRK